MALLLLQKHGTVTICHSRTQNLAEICRTADILVAAVGKVNVVTAWIWLSPAQWSLMWQ